MNILGCRILGCGLLIEDTLVFSDLHLGIELSFRGMNIPKYQYVTIKKIITSAIEKYKPKTVVINGDIKHEFSRINKDEWADVLDLIDTIKEKAELVIIKGNHDNMLEPVVKKRDLSLVDFYRVDDVLIIHGDLVIDIPKEIKTIIMGHEHPALVLQDENKKESFKCYLVGTFDKKNLIVMPSINQAAIGANILEEKFLSPYLKDISNFEVFVISSSFSNAEVLQFGKVKDL